MPHKLDSLVFDELTADPAAPINGETWLNSTDGDLKTRVGGATKIITCDAPLDKLDATVAPGVSDDNTAGYSIGSLWVDVTADNHYVCVDASTGAAVWKAAGATGPVGPAGPTGADGDMAWEGSWVSQNYVVNQCVEYGGSAYVCKLNTVASEVPTNATYWDVLCQVPTGMTHRYLYGGDQLDFPIDADWDISAAAAGSPDTTNAALTVRRFDDTTQEAVGFLLSVHSSAINIKITERSRAESAPASTKGVARTLHYRKIPDNGAVGAWSQYDLATADMPNNTYFQYDEQTIALATLSVDAGSVYQWQLSRDTADPDDQLPGDWSLLELGIEFT